MKIQRAYLKRYDKVYGTCQTETQWIIDKGFLVAIIDWDGYSDHVSQWTVWTTRGNFWHEHVHGFKTRAQAFRYIKSKMN